MKNNMIYLTEYNGLKIFKNLDDEKHTYIYAYNDRDYVIDNYYTTILEKRLFENDIHFIKKDDLKKVVKTAGKSLITTSLIASLAISFYMYTNADLFLDGISIDDFKFYEAFFTKGESEEELKPYIENIKLKLKEFYTEEELDKIGTVLYKSRKQFEYYTDSENTFGAYNPSKNEIYILSPKSRVEEYLKMSNDGEFINPYILSDNYIEKIIGHEIIHNLNKGYKNTLLDEGMNEVFTTYFLEVEYDNSYGVAYYVSSVLSYVIGFDKSFEFYKNGDIDSLKLELEKYISHDDVKTLFKKIEETNMIGPSVINDEIQEICNNISYAFLSKKIEQIKLNDSQNGLNLLIEVKLENDFLLNKMMIPNLYLTNDNINTFSKKLDEQIESICKNKNLDSINEDVKAINNKYFSFGPKEKFPLNYRYENNFFEYYNYTYKLLLNEEKTDELNDIMERNFGITIKGEKPVTLSKKV